MCARSSPLVAAFAALLVTTACMGPRDGGALDGPVPAPDVDPADPAPDAEPDAAPDAEPDATPHDAEPDATPHDAGPGATPHDAGPGACAEKYAACFADDECCVGFCAWPIDSYGPGACSPLIADGYACTWHNQCESAYCNDEGVCDGTCSAEGAACDLFMAPCCAGTVCTGEGAYIPGTCAAPFGAGAFCLHAGECASEACVDNVCE